MMIRRRTVSRKMDRPQAQPLSAGSTRLRPAWISTMTHAMILNSGSRKLRLTDWLLVLFEDSAAVTRRAVCRGRHRVVPARVEGVATGETAHRQPGTADGAVRAQRL